MLYSLKQKKMITEADYQVRAIVKLIIIQYGTSIVTISAAFHQSV